MVDRRLPLFVVYARPTDYPNHVVVRKWLDETPTDHMRLFEDLAAAREHLARQGLFCLHRSPDDDPKIVETWL